MTNESVTSEALGGARTHTRTSGVAHLSYQNDVHAMEAVRELVGFMPSSNRETAPVRRTRASRRRYTRCIRRTDTDVTTPRVTPVTPLVSRGHVVARCSLRSVVCEV